jgi:hypothetical protein
MRKAVSLCFSFIFISFYSIAQINKGDLQLGGGISFGRTEAGVSPTNSRSSEFTIRPSVGFTVNENRVVGIRGSYWKNSFKNNPNPDYKNYSYTAGVFYRRYHPLGKVFYLFADAGADYGRSKFDNSYPAGTTNFQERTSAALSLFPGITYVAGKHFHLELAMNNLVSLSYFSEKTAYTTSSGTSYNETNNLNLGINASAIGNLSVGFRIIL